MLLTPQDQDVPAELAALPERSDVHQMLCDAIALAPRGGLYLEFGVAEGRSLRVIRSQLPADVPLYGFDSFQGLPEAWNDLSAGAFATKFRVMLPNTKLVEGWFERTLPEFLQEHPEPVSFVNIDCDLYLSARCILFQLWFHHRFQRGTVVRFDELIGYPTWRDHEYRAFQEFIEASGYSYRYVGRARHSAVVQFTEVNDERVGSSAVAASA